MHSVSVLRPDPVFQNSYNHAVSPICLRNSATQGFYTVEPMETTTLDDRSPNITYDGDTWSLGGVPGEFDGTTTWTVTAGSTATINFLGRCAQNEFCTMFT